MKLRSLILGAAMMLSASAVFAQYVDFVEPKNGDTVPSTFTVRFAVDGMSVVPAGDMTSGTGHHHLLIDAADIEENKVIPMDDQHLHFGKGQTETRITLPPGKHKLTMQFADGAHRSYGAKYRKTIEVTVK
ncbi:MAG: hypothetical protein RL618_162 [Pseudomonadota bacterium]